MIIARKRENAEGTENLLPEIHKYLAGFSHNAYSCFYCPFSQHNIKWTSNMKGTQNFLHYEARA